MAWNRSPRVIFRSLRGARTVRVTVDVPIELLNEVLPDLPRDPVSVRQMVQAAETAEESIAYLVADAHLHTEVGMEGGIAGQVWQSHFDL